MKSPADMKIIQIEITNACPKRCSNCTRFCGHHKKPFFMDFETFKQAVGSMKGFKGILGIMGGEPTIHPEFEKFVRYYRDHVGYDDYSTACIEPTADFCKHILANAFHVDYSNHRGLWTSLNPRYYDNFELIQDTFGFQLINDHTNPSMHQTHMATRKELGIPDEEWVKLRDACWVQNLWSASITPKGAFFCEMAAAMDTTLGGPGGWKIEPGWWKRTPVDFATQLHWCELCSAALPMPMRDANQEIDDVSPVWREKLVQIDSPKVKRGLVHEFDPKAYSAGEHEVICGTTPYMDDQEQRIADASKVLQPRQIIRAAWLTEALAGDAGACAIERLQADARLDMVLSADPTHHVIADALGAPFLDTTGCSGTDIFRELRERTSARDWILLMHDGVPAPASLKLLGDCVFNPGCVYIRLPGRSGAGFQFFNVRAEALRHGGDLFGLTTAYPAHKVVRIASDRVSRYRLTPGRMFYRRAIKRAYWTHKRLSRKFARMQVAAQL